ncbi:MAG: mechanosensitive ion channel [Pirellulales bacterium]
MNAARWQPVLRGALSAWLLAIGPAALPWASGIPRASGAEESAVAADAAAAAESAKPAETIKPAETMKPADGEQDLAKRREELAQRMARLSELASSTTSTAGQPTAVVAANELKLLRTLDMVYLHQQTAQSQRLDAARQAAQYREELLALEASPVSPGVVYSWLALDDSRDRLDAERARVQSRASDVELARAAVELAATEAEHAERQRRRVIDEATLADDEDRAKFEYRRRMVDLEVNVAAANVELRRRELECRKAQQDAAEQHRLLLEAQVERMRPRAKFTAEDFEQRRRELDAYFEDMGRKLEAAQQRLRTMDAAVSNPVAASASASETTTAVAQANAWSNETRLFVRGVCHEEVLELERRIGDRQLVRDSAVGRFKLHDGQLAELEIVEWRDTCQRLAEQLDTEDRRLANRISELLQDLTTLHRESRLRSSGGKMPASPRESSTDAIDPAAANAATAQSRLSDVEARGVHLESLLRTLEFSQRHIMAMRRALGRFQSDLEERLPAPSQGWFDAAPEWASSVWNYELLAVGDQAITVSKITRGGCGFIAGLFIAAVVSRLLGRRVLPRVGLNHGASEALRTLCFYSLCLLFGVLSLELAHVPLTAFTFMGGAVAIGVGFGSQNILNNFISGLILLAEQPIRVGDLLELGAVHGTVERIGARSTTIRTGDNAEIVVPNSKLLEDNVVNLTRSDDRFRSSVTVGVAYGSPISEVKRCLLDAAQRPEVLASPAPFVLFADFADSTLTFELHFWVRLTSMTACRRVASDIRESIDAAFREAGIEMAFPQRDMHLSTLRPLEIQLSRPETLRIRKAA